MGRTFDRRGFVLGGLGAFAALARPLGACPRGDAERTLVLLQLSGGCDGLSLLVPYSDDVYGRSRRSTRIATRDVLRLDERVGLHPELARLRPAWDAGRLALVEGVGYPQPNRSHFRSLDIWHAADPRGRALGAGWIGRTLAHLPGAPPHAVVHLGLRPPFSLSSAERAPLCVTDGILRAADPERSHEGEDLEPEPTESAVAPHDMPHDVPHDALALVQERLRTARESTLLLRTAIEQHESPIEYPRARFARDLRSAAALIHAGIGVRVCSVELDGFDTHHDQRGRFARQMEELGGGLAAFLADLERSETGRAAVVLAFSEFGRRVEENASGGTDHGAASVAFALGVGVRGGLHGRAPRLHALDEGDLAFTTDFRALYANCLERVFELRSADVLGASFPGVEVV